MGQTSELHIQLQEELMNSINRAEEGEISHLDAFIFMEEERKKLELSLKIIKSYKEDNMSVIENEYLPYKNEGYSGYEIEVRSGGRMFDFKRIPEWETYKSALKECEDRYKQAFISKEKGLMIASEDGEEIILPEIYYRKSSIILKKKK